MTFGKLNSAMWDAFKTSIAVAIMVVMGGVLGIIVMLPIAFLGGTAQPLPYGAGFGAIIAVGVFCAALDKKGELP